MGLHSVAPEIILLPFSHVSVADVHEPHTLSHHPLYLSYLSRKNVMHKFIMINEMKNKA